MDSFLQTYAVLRILSALGEMGSTLLHFPGEVFGCDVSDFHSLQFYKLLRENRACTQTLQGELYRPSGSFNAEVDRRIY